MTSFTITTPTSASQALLAGELGFISADGALLGANVAIGSASLLNHGTIYAATAAISLIDSGSYIENHGSITGGGSYGVIDGLNGVNFLARLEVVNYGTITARQGWDASVILTASGGNRIFNSGSIVAADDWAILLQDIVGGAQGWGNRIVNSGVIDGALTGAILIYNNAADHLWNSGQIIGQIQLGDGSDTVRNSGLIEGSVSFGTGFGTLLDNTGTISGFVIMGSAGSTLRNSGVIQGTVIGGAGSDLYDLRGGTLAGTISDFSGDDRYYVDVASVAIEDGSGSDTVQAWVDFALGDGIERLVLSGAAARGTGNAMGNFIFGNRLGNVIQGDYGNDTVYGGGGADTILGGSDDDLIFGEAADDRIDCGFGNDSADGSDGHDAVSGDLGDDSLLGGFGRDTLDGGLGTDTLTGGAGADIFVFTDIADSGTTNATRDRVEDFVSGSDQIDLSAIDANANNAQDSAFTLVAAFTSSAGQLILRVSGASSFLEGDVNGDGVADFSIRLGGITALLGTDIVL